jgi:hypothetical protein
MIEIYIVIAIGLAAVICGPMIMRHRVKIWLPGHTKSQR